MAYSGVRKLSVVPLDEHLVDKYDVGGVSIDLVIRSHGEDSGYWTNKRFEVLNDFETWKKGDLVYINYQQAQEAFGHYAKRKVGEDIGIKMGTQKVYFFSPEYVELTIRNGVLIAPEGKCLCTQVERPVSELEQHLGVQYETEVFRVEVLGEPTPKHKIKLTNTNRATVFELTEAIPNVGEIIYVQNSFGVPLESERNRTLEKDYYLVEYGRILAKRDNEITPYLDRVVVKRNEPKTQVSSIYVPDAFKRKEKKGVVVSVGEGVEHLKVGDKVAYGKFAGLEVGDDLILMREQDIFYYEV